MFSPLSTRNYIINVFKKNVQDGDKEGWKADGVVYIEETFGTTK